MRPVTLFTIQWGDLPLEEMCRQAQEMGYEGLELSASHLDMKRAASDPEYVKEVKDTLKKYGLPSLPPQKSPRLFRSFSSGVKEEFTKVFPSISISTKYFKAYWAVVTFNRI